MGGIRIGIDVIEHDRFRHAMSRHPRLVERLFTASERDYCSSRPDPVQHFAARFAAKEAVGKAIGTGVTSWREIEITSGGKPEVRLSGRTQQAALAAGAGNLAVSMSHCGAISVSVAVSPPSS